jgi:hypothetical protein
MHPVGFTSQISFSSGAFSSEEPMSPLQFKYGSTSYEVEMDEELDEFLNDAQKTVEEMKNPENLRLLNRDEKNFLLSLTDEKMSRKLVSSLAKVWGLVLKPLMDRIATEHGVKGLDESRVRIWDADIFSPIAKIIDQAEIRVRDCGKVRALDAYDFIKYVCRK